MIDYDIFLKALNGVKSMSIFKQVENSEDQIEIWTLSTNDFDEWEEGKVFIEESRNYQVLLNWNCTYI